MTEAITAPAAAGMSLRIGVLSAIAKIDPREAIDNVSGMVLGQISGAPYGVGAGETTVRPRWIEPLQGRGPLQYSAAVRPGIRFSDGTALTAGIVARSLNGTKALANKAVVEAKSDQVWFTLSVPNPRFDLCLTQGNSAIVLDRGGGLARPGPVIFQGRPGGPPPSGAKGIPPLPPMMGRSVGVPVKDRDRARRMIVGNTIKLTRLSLLVPWAPRPYMPKPLPVAMLLQKQLGEIGIAVALHQPKTGEAFFDDLARGNYDLALAGWIADTPDPADYYEALLWSKMAEGDNHSNHSRWKNPVADEALRRFREAPTDENKRQIDSLVRDEAPLVPLIYGQSLVVHSRKIRNVSVSATGVLSLASVTMQSWVAMEGAGICAGLQSLPNV